MKRLIIIFFILLQNLLFAQKEGNIWYFGYNAGIDFNSGIAVPLTNGGINTFEGCASVCDKNGNLLFYTDGKTVKNRNHEIMPNGNNLMGGWSSTQSAIIVKKPGSTTTYCIFTIAEQGGSNGVRYSEVDLSLANGLGDINTNKNIPIVAPACEKITAIKHKNGKDFWIVIHLHNTNTFHSYLLSNMGIYMSPVVSNIGSVLNSFNGYLKSSINGRKIAQANHLQGNVEVFDFDNSTGILSNMIDLNNFPTANAYGVEFSQNNDLLYVSEATNTQSEIYQYNLAAGSVNDILDSKVVVGTTVGSGGALQLAPDKKIYHARVGKSYLGVIAHPDSIGVACNYSADGFHLGGRASSYGLPTFDNSIFLNVPNFTYSDTCMGDTSLFNFSSFQTATSLQWDFGDTASGFNNYAFSYSANHIFKSTGTFTVHLSFFIDDHLDTITKTIHINEIPSLNLGKDTTICDGKEITLDATAPNTSYLWKDSSTNSTLAINHSGTYWLEITSSGCSTSDTLIINTEDCTLKKEPINVPNIFTPNGDLFNDLFKINGIEHEAWQLHVYNRWGKLVYKSTDYQNDWDGGKLNSAIYYYLLSNEEDNNSSEYRGWVQIVR